MGVEAPGHIGAVGDIDTGHPLNQSGAIIPGSEITVDSLEFVRRVYQISFMIFMKGRWINSRSLASGKNKNFSLVQGGILNKSEMFSLAHHFARACKAKKIISCLFRVR
ncbi:hypothetical protein [Mixta intestinalis]|uniref:Uncharacterized protein n=1 Tax=Mixta intestinalis TaxID=1615494 RepID=A0A6P1Q8I5_9GAMM|nr:hypothetical protein [Mixta intestinalis]QHM74075.1 hypothetical protein C7M51_04436 [Mixta intestinalis]